jgi:hypothetical protein
MSKFLDIALEHAARGWYVFPLKPRDKYPVISKKDGGNGYKDATLDIEQIKAWWAKYPNANVGIACGASDLFVVDCDKGLATYEDFIAWRERNKIPVTMTVRTGRRTSYAVQMVFSGALETNAAWKLDGCSGEIRSIGGLIMSVGNIHPDTGEVYELLIDVPLAPRPEVFEQAVQQTKVERPAAPGEPLPMLGAGDGRHPLMMVKLGKAHAAGFSEQEAVAMLIALSDERFSDPISLEEIEQTVASCYAKWAPVEVAPEVTLGEPEEKKVLTDWREHYHSIADHDEVGPPRFLIEGFLPEQAIMGIGAFVGQKKTLAVLNIVWSLCSGEPLFGKYEVTRKPSRVLYLGPENGLMSFSNRVNCIGLRDYLCKTFFYTTMSTQEKRPLKELMPEEVEDAAIVIDTAIRFTDGSENDAAMMKEFAEHAFSLIRNKAACVIMLHHSPKSMTKANELTLENSFRGTGELSAFLSVALAMRTQDMEDEYGSASLLRFVKQRDFEPSPSSFEVKTSRETCRMTFVDGSAGATVTLGNTANKDGKDNAAVELLKANRKLSGVKMSQLLKDAGIDRSKEWVRLKRGELGLGGVKTGSTL